MPKVGKITNSRNNFGFLRQIADLVSSSGQVAQEAIARQPLVHLSAPYHPGEIGRGPFIFPKLGSTNSNMPPQASLTGGASKAITALSQTKPGMK